MKRQRKLEENDGGVASVFSILPEGCISSIIALTTPKDACRASTVSWGFKSASESDTVWEGFLPADCKEIISRFSEVAELRFVCWLDIQGKMPSQMLSLETTYTAYLVYKIAEDSQGLEVAAKASVTFTEATSSVSNTTDAGIGTDMSASISLLERESNFIYSSPSARPPRWPRRRYPQRRLDGWMEIFLGEFYNDAGDFSCDALSKRYEEAKNWERKELVQGKKALNYLLWSSCNENLCFFQYTDDERINVLPCVAVDTKL